jgi:hypothetical protein
MLVDFHITEEEIWEWDSLPGRKRNLPRYDGYLLLLLPLILPLLVHLCLLLPLSCCRSFVESAIYYEMGRLPGLKSGCCDMTGALHLSLLTLSMSHGPSVVFIVV